MGEDSYANISRRINRFRWGVPVLAFFLVLTHQLIEHTLLIHLPRWQHFATQMVFYGLVGPGLAWWALTSLRKSVRETEKAEQALQNAHRDLHEANQRLEFLIQINRRLAEVEDEEALAEIMLELTLEMVPALGCSLVRFDERKKPLPPIHKGDMSVEAFDAWSAHIASPETRQACQHCTSLESMDPQTCPLLNAIPESETGKKMYCLELTRGSRTYGVLNIYLADPNHPKAREEDLLKSMANEISLALESVRLRSRDLTTLYRLQHARQTKNLHIELTEMLTHVVEALQVDGGVLFLPDENNADLKLLAEAGQSLGSALGLVQGVANGAYQTHTPFVISDLAQEEGENIDLRSLLVAPLRTEEELLGCLVLWSAEPNLFSRRQVRLVATVAAQAALLIENHKLYLQAEQKAALAERARLAREIHDGLSQTLGYLKLRISQIMGWIENREIQRAATALGGVRELINESYLDAREAIDGLRIKPGEGAHDGWLDQVLAHFRKLSNIPIETTASSEIRLPPEVELQILRIVQEALGNIRKHSDATRARIVWRLDNMWLTLSISDNGRGFDPNDVPDIARHGLRIMQERTELLDADFQIVSQPDQGTEILVRLPREKIKSPL